MMGRLEAQEPSLFYDFCLEDHVPHDHLLRQIAKVIDLSDIRQKLAAYYSAMGRPSLDPELVIRMLLIGYIYGIRSERRLVEEVHLNLAYRWFCGLGLKGEVPERSSFSKTRHGRFRDSDAFRLLFESVLQTCLRAGLVSGETFATDASVIEADARVMRCTEGKEPPDDWNNPGKITRPVREYLEQLDKAAGDRHQGRDHRRCGSLAGALDGGSGGDPHHDRARRETLRPDPQAAGGGHRLWFRRQSGVADAARNRAAYSGTRP
jgi:transposase